MEYYGETGVEYPRERGWRAIGRGVEYHEEMGWSNIEWGGVPKSEKC